MYAVVYFIFGFAVMGLLMIPLARHYRKKIAKLESLAAEGAKSGLHFRDTAAGLAASLKQSAGSLAFTGQDTMMTGKNQSTRIAKIESAIDENAKVAAEIVEKTISVAAIASKMETDVLKGFSILEKNVKKMEDIKEKNSGVINGIVLLSNKVNKIRDIVRIINTITDQTKVIAFNAALESAGAGEAGKRFAVVAGEVNRLADDIVVLTRQIREQVEEIQTSSSSLIVYSEEGSDRIAEGYKLIKDLEDVFFEIRSGAEITSNQAQAITVSTQQQLKSSETIDAGISEISHNVKSLIGICESTAMSAGSLSDKSGELEKYLAQEIGRI